LDLNRLEFHRSGLGLVPLPGEPEGHAIYIPRLPESERSVRSCSCEESRETTCSHLLELSERLRSVEDWLGRRPWEEVFARTLWFRLAGVLADEDPTPWGSLRVRTTRTEGKKLLSIDSERGEELARWMDGSGGRLRLLERLGKRPIEGEYTDRAGLLERLARLQLTRQERLLEKAGMKSRRQSREESFWFRLAYHCSRELGEKGVSFHPAIHRKTGSFTLTCRRDGEEALRFAVPRGAVEPALRLLAAEFPEQEDLALHPIPLKTIFRVSPTTEIEGNTFDVRPVIVALQRTGERRYIQRDDFETFRYGRLLWVPELELLAELEKPGKERKFRAPRRLRLSRSQVPAFLDDHEAELAEGSVVLEEPLRNLKIYRDFDRFEIRAGEVSPSEVVANAPPPRPADPDGPAGEAGDEELDTDLDEVESRSWYWLSVHYGVGSGSVSLTELLRARRDGLPYLEVGDGWIDLFSPAVEAVEAVFDGRDGRSGRGHPADGEGFHLGLPELLRLHAASENPLPVDVLADDRAREVLDRLVQLRPALPYRPPRALVSGLREYQVLGVNWLRFLAENGLGGLLCDDMGLGKTHQAMALIASLVEQNGIDGPYLVVSPTTVLPHWRAKLRDHAPGLTAVVHHGPQRDLETNLRQGQILLTSYGILRNDAEALAQAPFALAVFDEIQHLKNRGTLGYKAAAGLTADLKLGLTGTPIENSLTELKALFDLVLPGYLGSDARFEARYGVPPDAEVVPRERLEELRRQTSPFVLRRTKEAVLDELPEKIEDLRLCSLSDDQVSLYRKAVEGRGAELAGQLRSGTGPVPYIHVFALLNLLKQVCDHPALALGELDRADEYSSGKWDLFRELLEESLDSGQKVVVFTQYLGMVNLIQRHLRSLGIDHTTLTGSSRNRGDLVDRFNNDPDCRVFVGSLKAGGTGIDLVGGSVVIHYDRWWNAAREDQATDRVHRMGQHRAVQVFKLVSEGTLEEKIHAIIERKRRLAESVVKEDDPRLAKLFTREELLELLTPV
jgi:superfamily II DNA or RNA helicase